MLFNLNSNRYKILSSYIYDRCTMTLSYSILLLYIPHTWWWCNSRLYSKIQLVERSVRNIIGNRMKQTTWNHLCLYMSHRVRERECINWIKKNRWWWWWWWGLFVYTNLLNNIYSTQEKRMCVVVWLKKRGKVIYTHRWCGDTANSNINSQGCEHNDIVRQQRI